MTNNPEHPKDEIEPSGDGRVEAHTKSDPSPEPPSRFSPNSQETQPYQPTPETPSDSADGSRIGVIGRIRFKVAKSEIAKFETARRNITISQVAAVISLFFGGVLVSAIAIAFAIAAYVKLQELAASRTDEPEVQRALKRTGVIAIIVSVAALALNAITVAYLYPMLAGTLQSGGFDMFGISSTPSGTGSPNVTWG